MSKTQHTPWKITREELTDHRNNKAYNVFVENIHVGGYTGPIDLNNRVEKRALQIITAVNEREWLIEALRGILPFADTAWQHLKDAAIIALAKAEAE